ncbi:MAG TPA: hypothetical protein DCG71_05460 [Brevundimonas sp.]|nr:hypothetical protein [Brevundimonas sp.]
MMLINQTLETATSCGQAAERGRGAEIAPTKPCAGRKPAGLNGFGGRHSGLEAIGFETVQFGHDDAQTDALMQPTSSASMQLANAHPELRECERMNTPAAIRKWMLDTLEATGLTVKKWAADSGVAPSTIHRALKEDYQFVTSNRTLSKLASAAGVSAPDQGSAAQIVGAEFLPIRYDVGAGLWQEVADAQIFLGVGTVAPDPAYAGFPQWLERVQGDSMDEEYRQGEMVHVVDAIALGYSPQHGDHVILVRRRNDGAEMERTIKEVVRTPDGRLEFWPRSTNARWRQPIILHHGLAGDETVEVEVAALVIGSYRPRRR